MTKKLDSFGFEIERDPQEEESSSAILEEGNFSTEQVIELAKTDIDFLAALSMPSIFEYFFPPVYKAVWAWLIDYVSRPRAFPQLALGLPRGFAKTTVVKLFILLCILFTKRQFILVISETLQKSINIISDVIDMLNEPNIKRTFGDWKLGVETDRQDLKKFGFRGRDIILMAAGADTGIRGITIKNRRPDIMIFEDIQSKTVAESQTQSEALMKHIIGTAMKTKSPKGCLYIFVANMYPTKWSILRQLKQNPRWVKFIAGGILADGTSLWEELQPVEQLMAEFENDLAMGHPEIFYAEVLNDEHASVNKNIDLSRIPEYPFTDGEISAGSFIIIDPSGDKAKSDAVSIGYYEVYNGIPCLMEIVEDRMSPGTTIREALKLCFKHNCRLVAIESNGYQASLNYWFEFICEQQGVIGIEAVEIYSGSKHKNSRILDMFQLLLKGEIHIHPDARPAVFLQITQFNALKRDNVDGLLDLLTYPHKVLEQYQNAIISQSVLEIQEWQALEVPEFNSPF